MKHKVALVHDYLNEFGGAERVLKALVQIYPQAPIYTIFYRKNSLAYKEFKNQELRVSWFHHLPWAHKLISPLRFLIPLTWAQFSFKNYDLVITSASWAVTKGMRNAQKEICYLHTPPRYLYGFETSRRWQDKWYQGLIRIYALVVNHFLRLYDFRASQKVDFFLVNSQNVGQRVEKFYRRRDYEVVYPPVEIDKFLKQKDPVQGNYYLTGGRLTAAKNFDLIIKAAQKANINLKIFGTGSQEEKLKKIGGKNAEFLGNISDAKLVKYYQGAKAFILAQKDEDFGITPIEAAAAGTPSIAYAGGGYLESIVDGKTGIFFTELTVTSLAEAIKRAKRMKWNKKNLQAHAKKFSQKRFKEEIENFVSKNVTRK